MLNDDRLREPEENAAVEASVDADPAPPADCVGEVVSGEAKEVAELPHAREGRTPPERKLSYFDERDGFVLRLPKKQLAHRTRRDLLLFGAASLAGAAALRWTLPATTQARMGLGLAVDSEAKEAFLNRALRFDDDVAEALTSRDRMVRTYAKSHLTHLRNNYAGLTPDASYIAEWTLTLEGLETGSLQSLTMRTLRYMFPLREQITRLVCVEGWSAIACWDGFSFDRLLHAFPPADQARFARIESSVNLDGSGNPDPYYVSLDLQTARHPQTLLATHFNGQELGPDHGAPLRLIAPMKLGLKNVKAITRIVYAAEEPADYWADRGYSRFDGL